MNQFFSEICNMVFLKNKFGFLEPLYYDAKRLDNGRIRGKKIEKGTVYWDFLRYVRTSSKIVDKRTGEATPGYLEAYQYAIAFKIIDSCMNLCSEDILGALSRQA